MTFEIGQLVRCVDQGHSGRIQNGLIYKVTNYRVDSDGDDFVTLEGVVREFFASRFESLEQAPVEPKPKVVLNEKAKKPSQTNAVPEGCVVFTHQEYVMYPHRVASSPLWQYVKKKLPMPLHHTVYAKIRDAFSSPSTSSLKPHSNRLIDAFTWSSAPHPEFWHPLHDAIVYGIWTGLHDYLESHSEA